MTIAHVEITKYRPNNDDYSINKMVLKTGQYTTKCKSDIVIALKQRISLVALYLER